MERYDIEVYVEKYFGLDPEKTHADLIIPGCDYGQIINLLCMFRDEMIKSQEYPVKEEEIVKVLQDSSGVLSDWEDYGSVLLANFEMRRATLLPPTP